MKTIYTLHKLPEGFIITSDEKPKDGDLAIHPNGIIGIVETALAVALFKETSEGSFIEDCKKIIAQQDQIDFSSLTEEEQKEIGWFDIEKLAYDNCQTWEHFGTAQGGYIKGFKKAQELLSDRRFTLEDMEAAACFGMLLEQCKDDSYKLSNDEEWKGFLQSLFQPKSWKVELEMEYQDMMGVWVSKATILEHLDRPTRPKLTNSKVIITKIL